MVLIIGGTFGLVMSAALHRALIPQRSASGSGRLSTDTVSGVAAVGAP